jgi:hypothetical protein
MAAICAVLDRLKLMPSTVYSLEVHKAGLRRLWADPTGIELSTRRSLEILLSRLRMDTDTATELRVELERARLAEMQEKDRGK